MRHVLSLVTGMVVAPLVWLLVAAGQAATKDGFPTSSHAPRQLVIGGAMLIGVGLLAGLIASLRTSPLGAVFASVVFLDRKSVV